MEKKIYGLIIFLLYAPVFVIGAESRLDDQEMVTISGRVSHFDGNPVDSALVEIKNDDFSTAYSTHTDSEGYYELTVKPDKYLALLSVRMDEYPRFSKLPEEEQKLEFWAWNFIARSDTVIDISYDRLEIYGFNAFRIYGATPGYTIYCRPMSLGLLYAGNDDLCPEPEDLDIDIEINGSPAKLNMVQKVKEYVPDGELYGLLLHVGLPENKAQGEYDLLSENNSRWSGLIAPRHAIVRRESWSMDLGVKAWLFGYDKNLNHGYYDPKLFESYMGTAYANYRFSQDNELFMMAGLGMIKDDTMGSYRPGGNIDFIGTVGIYKDWQLQGRTGYMNNQRDVWNDDFYDIYYFGLSIIRRF